MNVTLEEFSFFGKSTCCHLASKLQKKPESQKEDQKHIEPESQKEDQKHNEPESLQKIRKYNVY